MSSWEGLDSDVQLALESTMDPGSASVALLGGSITNSNIRHSSSPAVDEFGDEDGESDEEKEEEEEEKERGTERKVWPVGQVFTRAMVEEDAANDIPLGAHDDDDEVAEWDAGNQENLIFCQYTNSKIRRRRKGNLDQWVVELRDGVMKLNNKDFVFDKASCNLVFSSLDE
jgi:hypothetical protein